MVKVLYIPGGAGFLPPTVFIPPLESQVSQPRPHPPTSLTHRLTDSIRWSTATACLRTWGEGRGWDVPKSLTEMPL